jgi:C1A family cysteine protease
MNLKQIASPNLAAHLPRLAALGFETLEQLQGAAEVAAPELSAFLGADVASLLGALPAAAAIAPAALAEISTAEYQLGVELDLIPPMRIAPFRFALVAAAAPLPASVSHVAQMPPVKNQGNRGACVAFATLAAYEFELVKAGALQRMSEQFQYWNCKRTDGIPNSSGTWLGVSYPLLKRDGVCDDATWPYNPNVINGNEGQGPPPPGAQLAALAHRQAAITQLAPTDVEDLKAALANNHCVSFSVPVFNSWWRSTAVANSGDITMPIPGEVRAGGHAMCLVGYVDDATVAGGGRFILRNSWGTSWGINSPHGKGYGTIPYAYLAAHGAEAWYPG